MCYFLPGSLHDGFGGLDGVGGSGEHLKVLALHGHGGFGRDSYPG